MVCTKIVTQGNLANERVSVGDSPGSFVLVSVGAMAQAPKRI